MSTCSLAERLELVRDGFSPTPLRRLDDDRVNLYAKLEFGNPNGSSKDRSAFWILRQAILRGEIGPDSTITESSSGNFAVALASFCRTLGLAFVPVLDPNVNRPTEAFLDIACDRVEKVHELDDTGGFLLTRLARVARLRTELDRVYWPNQYANQDAAEAHYELTGAELVTALDHIDYLFVGVGTGATITGLSRRIKASSPGVRVIAVDAEGSMISGGPSKRRYIPGIGSSMHAPMVDQADIDEMLVVSERETVSACHELLRRQGLFAGGSTGGVYAAISRYFSGYQGPPPTVVFLAADRGNAYAETVYNPSWVSMTIDREAGAEPSSPTPMVIG